MGSLCVRARSAAEAAESTLARARAGSRQVLTRTPDVSHATYGPWGATNLGEGGIGLGSREKFGEEEADICL